MNDTDRGVGRSGLEVAVIGLAGRFPGANSVAEFWDAILRKKETISRFSRQDLYEEGIPQGLVDHPDYVRAAGIIDRKEFFDPFFFGYSPNEARLLDPQLRIFHECVWEALEDAGCDPFTFAGRIGLYAGCSPNFGWELIVRESGLRDVVGDYSASLFSDKDSLTQHISYRLNLRGPSVNIQTACSTSLVAVHLACQGLLSGDCDIALAGGVSASCLRKSGYLYQEGSILSPDGHCRTFDAKAAGSVFGEGAGVVLLKPLEAALAENDHIYAIIRGSSVNNDGHEKVGFTATSINAQVDLISTAHQAAGLEAADISFVEAHGSATPLGDPIEIEALRRAFRASEEGGCFVGSVKTNVGHLNRAAGITGLIKAVMALHERELPAHLHYTGPNSSIDFGETPFVVNTDTAALSTQDVLAAGVSSFGIGGTNAHIVLEGPPVREASSIEDSPELLVLSAKSISALDQVTARLTEFLQTSPKPPPLAEIAYTLQEGRAAFDVRRVLVAASLDEVVERTGKRSFLDREVAVETGPLIFMFPGQGAQYSNMGRVLYERFREFRRVADECFKVFKATVGWDLKSYLYPHDSQVPSPKALANMRVLQPAIFVFEYSLARYLMQAGIQPDAMIGYSLGEYTAACLAGVFTLGEALALVALRGVLMQQMPAGRMLSVPLPEAEIVPLLRNGLSLAAANGPACVIAGEPAAIAQLEKDMQRRGLLCMPVQTQYAGHTNMQPSLKTKLRDRLESTHLTSPTMPFISSLTGTWITPEQAVNSDYWIEHMTCPIRFYQGLDQVAARPNALLIEVGAGRDLTLLAGRVLKPELHQAALPIIPPADQASRSEVFFLEQLGRLWMRGQSFRWPRLFSRDNVRKTSLPSYPFERQPYWPETGVYQTYAHLKSGGTSDRRLPMEKWGHAATWTRAGLIANSPTVVQSMETTVIFMDDGVLGANLAVVLERNGNHVIRVRRGKTFQAAGPDEFYVNPEAPGDYVHVLKALDGPVNVFHLWNMTATDGQKGWPNFVSEQYNGYFSLQFIAQVLGGSATEQAVALYVISTGLQNVAGDEPTSIEKAPLLGAVQVLPLEYPGLVCRSVDLIEFNVERQVQCLLAELAHSDPVREVAYRGGSRWVKAYRPIHLPPEDSGDSKLLAGATYLITGGLGDMGLVLAQSLAERQPVKLLLTGRSFFPEKKDWPSWVDEKGTDDPVSRKIRKLQQIEALGSAVSAGQVDCTDQMAMQEYLLAHCEEASSIRGVVHAAGIVDGALIQRRSVETCLNVMKPKIQGLYVLESLLPVNTLDFFVTFSSVSAVIPSAGQIAYCASNLFLDRWAAERAQHSGISATSIGWDIWSEVGMGARAYRHLRETGGDKYFVKAKESALRDGLRNLEGVEIFYRILGQNEPHVIVSTRPLNPAPDADRAMSALLDIERPPPVQSPMPRPSLCTSYVPPATSNEERVAKIWQQYFGIVEIGRHDDFFELGGDSLKAGIVLHRLHKELHVTIPMGDFYKNSRVDRLAALVDVAQQSIHALIPRLPPAEHFEVSHAQLRLWVQHMLDASGFAYNRSSALRFKGAFDVELYTQCFQALVERHEGLRTSFVADQGVPRQKIHASLPIVLIDDDLSSEPAFDAKLKEIVREELCFKFELENPPLFRVRVVKTATDEFLSVFTAHHIICDEHSINVLQHELSHLYNTRLRGLASLATQNICYKDYAAWNNRMAATEEHRAFWLDRLSGDLPSTAFPPDKLRPSEKTNRGKVLQGNFSPAVAESLRGLRHSTNASLFMVLVALVETLVYRHTGDEDILLGTAVVGRDHVQTESLVGFFVNSLPLRYKLQGSLTFEALLAQTCSETLAAYDHQAYPFDKIVEDLQLPRDPSRNPLFEIMILLHPDSDRDAKFDGLVAEQVAFPGESSLFDLTFNFRTEDQGIEFSIEYNPDLYSDDKIEQLTRHLAYLAQSVASDPKQPLQALAIMSPDEERQLVLPCHERQTSIPHETSLGQWFEQSVERRPDDVAVVCGSGALTYRELNARVNQVAHYLINHVQPAPDSRIGVCVERSENLVVAIWAVLKAGCAYVPIDPDFPTSRIQYLAQDSQVMILLVDDENERLQSIGAAVPLVPLGKARTSNSDNPPSVSGSHHLAYVTYTSGSSGDPKGVMIEHRNVLNYLQNCVDVFGVSPKDSVYGLTPITFDISVMELVCTLLVGARLVLEPNIHDMEQMAICIVRERISVLQMTPTRLQAYLELNSIETLAGVRIMLVGGETLQPKLLPTLSNLGNTRVFHVYGPTETTIWSSSQLIAGGSLSLGLPLAGEEICILSDDGMLMPAGAPGEICIAGEGVGRGYLNQPELTANQFVTASSLPGRRVYRTGDLGVLTIAGELKYIGRSDNQVKIRGVRVETGEIEEQLLRNPGVDSVAVIVRDKDGDGSALWAYVVSCAEEVELRRYLADVLPFYMVPEVFVFVENLPLTANGKIDRQALLRRDDRDAVMSLSSDRVPTPIEEQLIQIWGAVLGTSGTVDLGGSFFALGGNSLKAAQMLAQIQSAFGVTLELRDIFTSPTIIELACLLEAFEWAAKSNAQSDLEPEVEITI